ncbi:MAG: hypothetical protein ACFFCS_05375 [Candidatus Hodarchaeota archaeon]
MWYSDTRVVLERPNPSIFVLHSTEVKIPKISKSKPDKSDKCCAWLFGVVFFLGLPMALMGFRILLGFALAFGAPYYIILHVIAKNKGEICIEKQLIINHGARTIDRVVIVNGRLIGKKAFNLNKFCTVNLWFEPTYWFSNIMDRDKSKKRLISRWIITLKPKNKRKKEIILIKKALEVQKTLTVPGRDAPDQVEMTRKMSELLDEIEELGKAMKDSFTKKKILIRHKSWREMIDSKMSEPIPDHNGILVGAMIGLTGFVFMALGIYMLVFIDLIIMDISKDYVPMLFLVLAVFGAVFLLSWLTRTLTRHRYLLKDLYF